MSIAEKLTTIAENQQKVYDAGYLAGKAEGSGEEEIFFTSYGTMYKKHHVILSEGHDGLTTYGYRYADKMETLSVPNQRSEYTANTYVFQGCTSLKTASLPKIMRIGVRFFDGCTSLEEVTLGCEEYPMVTIEQNTFQNCSALVRLNWVGAITTSFSLQWSPLLDDVSIQNIVDSLADLTGQTTQTLTVHQDVRNKMTDEQVNTIVNVKNWTLAPAASTV